ncbi:uncharacterized protein BKA78DRAFT_355782 [Phyllosticta capitalensis]|uniref:uncharacterized protein n=1 Tax=Phyllosticta capitalensis TaxID=121624 RepID=UPI00312F3D11
MVDISNNGREPYLFITTSRPSIATSTEIATSLSEVYDRTQPLDVNGFPAYTSSELALLLREANHCYRNFEARRKYNKFSKPWLRFPALWRLRILRIFLDFYDEPAWERRLEPIDYDDPKGMMGHPPRASASSGTAPKPFGSSPTCARSAARRLTMDAAARGAGAWVEVVAQRAPERRVATWDQAQAVDFIGELDILHDPTEIERVRQNAEKANLPLPAFLDSTHHVFADINAFMDAADAACRSHGAAAVSANLWLCFASYALRWWIACEDAERERLLASACMDEWRTVLRDNATHLADCDCKSGDGYLYCCGKVEPPGF